MLVLSAHFIKRVNGFCELVLMVGGKVHLCRRGRGVLGLTTCIDGVPELLADVEIFGEVVEVRGFVHVELV